jgi:hypothetical protein
MGAAEQQPSHNGAPFPESVATHAIRDFNTGEGKGKKKKQKQEKPRRLGSERGIETMFRTSYSTHVDMSSLADSKANIMISINGIIMSVILASISPKIDSNPWLLLPTSVLLISCLVSIVYAILAARPRVSSSSLTLDKVRNENANILFFGNFVSLSEEDFRLGMTDLMQTPERLYDNMIRDIYGLGKVLTRKFAMLRVAYTVFMFGLATSVILYLIVYLAVVMRQPMTPVVF